MWGAGVRTAVPVEIRGVAGNGMAIEPSITLVPGGKTTVATPSLGGTVCGPLGGTTCGPYGPGGLSASVGGSTKRGPGAGSASICGPPLFRLRRSPSASFSTFFIRPMSTAEGLLPVTGPSERTLCKISGAKDRNVSSAFLSILCSITKAVMGSGWPGGRIPIIMGPIPGGGPPGPHGPGGIGP